MSPPQYHHHSSLPLLTPLKSQRLPLSSPPTDLTAAIHLSRHHESMEQDWDLNAVVRGCAAANSAPTENLDSRDHLLSFLRPFEGRNEIEEFRNLYKKTFFTKSETPLIGGMTEVNDLDPHRPLSTLQQKHLHVTVSKTKKPKRRKNPQKKICHMPAEGLTSDVWAWRKYGQKPIKGSPYPRGYYRCSSSKACLARKQVERNRSDPSMFIVTFTAEHNHPVPTHRSSLAGSTRQKPIAAAEDGGSCDTTSNPKTTSPDVRAAENDENNRLTEMAMDDDELFAGLEELAGTSRDEFFPEYIPASFPQIF